MWNETVERSIIIVTVNDLIILRFEISNVDILVTISLIDEQMC